MNMGLKVKMGACLLGMALGTVGVTQATTATGFVHVEQIDGVWWFISPTGEKFISMGVNHIEPHLWLAPYNKQATLDRYGNDMVDENGRFDTSSEGAEKWINRQVEICDDLHFNTFGKHTHESIDDALYRDQVYYMASFKTAPTAYWREQAGEGPLPDVFAPGFRDFVEIRAEEVCAAHKDSPNMLGYMYTDIPNWIMPKYQRRAVKEEVMVYPWVNAMLRQGVTTPGKQRWIKLLQDRYSTPEEAATVWGLPVSADYGITWEQMARLFTWFKPADLKKADADMVAFMEQIANQWYRIHYEAIKKRDAHHLIFGDKSMVESYRKFLVPALRQYVDVVVIQAYNPFSKDAPTTDWIYEEIGKPIFNGDGSFANIRPNQTKYKVKGWWTGAKSIEEVARMYKTSLEDMMAKPYMIGWHHCGCMEQWDTAARGDVDSNETGFMDPFENYHTVFTDVIRDTNARVNKLHEAAK
ncbi:hypothetical protein [Pontiella agarivorans]|uniref:Agarase n=1 Tax=Pontiella agarivorans TaxID=3038953 RepID=A0ABU5MY24_9BACT|nr:hypothetical protein [Pontiella agarivorans]MDZ8119106.1 hypothetical protein [Pontiella agarivorans]